MCLEILRVLMEQLNEQDKIKESIRFNIEKFRLAVIAILTIGGGTISLINDNDTTGRQRFFIAMGLFSTIVAISWAIKFFKTITQQIK
jgi:hypothetical protein